MKLPTYPKGLDAAAWEKQAGSFAKEKGVTLGADLKDLEKQFGAIKFDPLDVEKIASFEDAEACLEAFSGDWGKSVKALCDALRALETAAARLEAGWRKDNAAKAAATATAAVVRGGAELRSLIESSVAAAGPKLMKRRAELREAEQKAAEQNRGKSPEAKRLATRIIDQFRIVKNRPDREVNYLLCLGRERGSAFLGPTASDSNKPLLTKAIDDDTGFKFYKGRCKWEEGSYTFVGPAMSKTIARRIEEAVRELTGTRYRIRARTAEPGEDDE